MFARIVLAHAQRRSCCRWSAPPAHASRSARTRRVFRKSDACPAISKRGPDERSDRDRHQHSGSRCAPPGCSLLTRPARCLERPKKLASVERKVRWSGGSTGRSQVQFGARNLPSVVGLLGAVCTVSDIRCLQAASSCKNDTARFSPHWVMGTGTSKRGPDERSENRDPVHNFTRISLRTSGYSRTCRISCSRRSMVGMVEMEEERWRAEGHTRQQTPAGWPSGEISWCLGPPFWRSAPMASSRVR